MGIECLVSVLESGSNGIECLESVLESGYNGKLVLNVLHHNSWKWPAIFRHGLQLEGNDSC